MIINLILALLILINQIIMNIFVINIKHLIELKIDIKTFQ